jgi:hypothetical protein
VPGLVLAQADDPAIIDSHMGRVNLAAEHVNQLGIFEEQFGRSFAAGDAKLVLNLTHKGRA